MITIQGFPASSRCSGRAHIRCAYNGQSSSSAGTPEPQVTQRVRMGEPPRRPDLPASLPFGVGRSEEEEANETQSFARALPVVHLGCYETPQTRRCINDGRLFRTALEAVSLRSGWQHSRVLVRTLLLVSDGRLPCCPHAVEGALWDPFYGP